MRPVILSPKFFNRDSHKVAKELLGKFLVRRVGHKELSSMITEVEVYDGPNDLASHASKGLTSRTSVMFSHPGYWYVYLCYGIHFMLNIVTREHGYPAAILIRGVEDAVGPGRLTKYFNINKSLNAKKVSKENNLWVEDRGVKINKSEILETPRIGVSYAGADWSKRPLRFVIKNKISQY